MTIHKENCVDRDCKTIWSIDEGECMNKNNVRCCGDCGSLVRHLYNGLCSNCRVKKSRNNFFNRNKKVEKALIGENNNDRRCKDCDKEFNHLPDGLCSQCTMNKRVKDRATPSLKCKDCDNPFAPYQLTRGLCPTCIIKDQQKRYQKNVKKRQMKFDNQAPFCSENDCHNGVAIGQSKCSNHSKRERVTLSDIAEKAKKSFKNEPVSVAENAHYCNELCKVCYDRKYNTRHSDREKIKQYIESQCGLTPEKGDATDKAIDKVVEYVIRPRLIPLGTNVKVEYLPDSAKIQLTDEELKEKAGVGKMPTRKFCEKCGEKVEEIYKCGECKVAVCLYCGLIGKEEFTLNGGKIRRAYCIECGIVKHRWSNILFNEIKSANSSTELHKFLTNLIIEQGRQEHKLKTLKKQRSRSIDPVFRRDARLSMVKTKEVVQQIKKWIRDLKKEFK